MEGPHGQDHARPLLGQAGDAQEGTQARQTKGSRVAVNTTAVVIDSLNAKIAHLQESLDAALARAAESERAWVEAVNARRDAEELLKRLEQELSEEAD